MTDAFTYASLGDRFAIIRQRPGECWKVLYYVSTEGEAAEFVALCVSRDKHGASVVASIAAGMSFMQVMRTAENWQRLSGRRAKRAYVRS